MLAAAPMRPSNKKSKVAPKFLGKTKPPQAVFAVNSLSPDNTKPHRLLSSCPSPNQILVEPGIQQRKADVWMAGAIPAMMAGADGSFSSSLLLTWSL
jgi:hypothetical protein